MTQVTTKYLIVGGGMAADAAVRGIREHDPDGKIVMVSKEPFRPYNRPPLSKKLWTGKQKLEQIWRGTEKYNVDFHLGCEIVSLDPSQNHCTDDQGRSYLYEKLLLATGGTPIHLSEETGEVIYFRTVSDYQKLRDLAKTKDSFLIIGGGYIGSEVAAALRMQGKQVSMVFPEDGIAARLLPAAMSSFINDYYESKGVHVHAGYLAEKIEKVGNKLVVETNRDLVLEADVVVAGLGIRPNTQLAESAGLKVENGILVDETLATSAPNIYAAGDVARFYSSALRQTLRTEHEEHANMSGQLAGKSMAGANVSYNQLPFGYTDLFDLGFELVGLIDPRLALIGDWQEPYKTGVVYYYQGKRVVGVLLANMWGRLDKARQLIEDENPPSPTEIRGYIS